MTIKNWQWQVAPVRWDALQMHLDKGWEPFAVTLDVHNLATYYMRRKVPVHG